MGACGAGGFEIDTAPDFAGAISGVDDTPSAFSAAPGQAIEADPASVMIAAAECVAAMLGRPCGDLPDDPAERLGGYGKPDATLLGAAGNHVKMVISHSDLSELSADADDPAEFTCAMTGLIDRLDPDIRPKATRRKSKMPFFNVSPCASATNLWAKKNSACLICRSTGQRRTRPPWQTGAPCLPQRPTSRSGPEHWKQRRSVCCLARFRKSDRRHIGLCRGFIPRGL
jgi:hypothetical protein